MKKVQCKCGIRHCICAECGTRYTHGEQSHCGKPLCRKVNAPLDCEGCGFVVSSDKRGVLNFDMDLIPYDTIG